jgi:hypothetical protein
MSDNGVSAVFFDLAIAGCPTTQPSFWLSGRAFQLYFPTHSQEPRMSGAPSSTLARFGYHFENWSKRPSVPNSAIVITFVLLTAFCSSPGSLRRNKLRGPEPDSGAARPAARVFENLERCRRVARDPGKEVARSSQGVVSAFVLSPLSGILCLYLLWNLYFAGSLAKY